MILSNLRYIHSDDVIDIRIQGSQIANFSKTASTSSHAALKFENATVLPGLINSHDHLDFNLFPQLGNTHYNNYREWANHIHETYAEEIAAVLRIPEALRIQWGIYKNMVCGVTTVVNHGKFVPVKNDIITVLQYAQSLHSLAFEKNLFVKLNNPLKRNTPVAIHVGEGIDESAEKEIDKLTSWNLLKRDLLAIHGISMNSHQAKKFRALIWCPASNYFLFNSTANIHALKQITQICFGSDSTLTSNWNIWDHIRQTYEKTGVTSSELLDTLTSNPATIWKINTGEIAIGKSADIVVVKSPAENSLFHLDPESILLVIHKGQVSLYDESLKKKFTHLESFFPIKISHSVKYVKGNIHQLIDDIKHLSPSIQLPFTKAEANSLAHA